MRKKLENMTVKEINAELESNKTKQQEVIKVWQPLEKKLNTLMARERKLTERSEKIEFDKKASQKRMDWAWLLRWDWQDSTDKHTFRDTKLREIGLSTSGYFRDLEQSQVRIALVKNDPKSLPATIKGLNKVLKHIKPIKGSYKQIDIFDHTLSEGGVYRLMVSEEKSKYKIQITRYHREEILHEFNNLKEALALIQKKYYYEDADAEDSRW